MTNGASNAEDDLLDGASPVPGNGDLDQLVPVIYEELRGLARRLMAGERSGHTLQPTALVHEAYLKLAREGGAKWQGNNHFFAAAAEAMRRILVDRARRARRLKRGAGWLRIDLDRAELSADGETPELLDVDAALSRLEQIHAKQAEVVKLRFFAGLSVPETAAALSLTESTVQKHWRFARAWLLREINRGVASTQEEPS